MPYIQIMQTVVETPEYLAKAKAAGVSDEERAAIVDTLANRPDAGDLIVGTGGARKVRFRRPGTGKSGGYRVITYFGGGDIPVYLLTMFAKGQRGNLSHADINAIRAALPTIVAPHKGKGD